MKKTNYIILLAALIAVFASCSKVLDKRDLSAIQGDLVFGDSVLARTYVDYIYDQNLPGWGGTAGLSANLSDESYGESKYFEGTLTITDVADFGTAVNNTNNYAKIRAINDFLSKIETGGLSRTWKNTLKGQVYFFRAWRYFELVKLYGGVPLVLKPLEAVGDSNKIFAALPRNKTSECIAQITMDLDSAFALLPGKWGSTDWGRVTSGTAAALKSRVLLYWASPQFNPTGLTTRWQSVYDAAKQAKTTLSANGYALNASYDQMWFTEVNNPEAVFVTGYNNLTGDQTRKNNSYDQSVRPAFSGGSGSNQPVKEMVDAYPMKDGKKITDATTKYPYDATLFYKNRDPRFDKTISYNGVAWTLNSIPYTRFWYYLEGTAITTGPSNNRVATNTGFFIRKAVNSSTAISDVPYIGTDWMEIRYAEVLLNLAEAATGVNKLDEAYTELKAIRARAGIEAGTDNLYGLKANMTRAEMFDAITYERQIEFAFEGKRYRDLRRNKLIETVLNGKRRTGITYTFKASTAYPNTTVFSASRDAIALDDVYKNNMTVATKSMDTRYAINWKPEYYFFALPQSTLDNNISLKQTTGWPNGTFDPLQ